MQKLESAINRDAHVRKMAISRTASLDSASDTSATDGRKSKAIQLVTFLMAQPRH